MRICICDDNLLHSNMLESFILKYQKKFLNFLFETDVYASGDKLLNNIDSNNTIYQLIFLDIEREGLNGIEIAVEYVKKIKMF